MCENLSEEEVYVSNSDTVLKIILEKEQLAKEKTDESIYIKKSPTKRAE